jgi:hypothetical protein
MRKQFLGDRFQSRQAMPVCDLEQESIFEHNCMETFSRPTHIYPRGKYHGSLIVSSHAIFLAMLPLLAQSFPNLSEPQEA